ncbi:MAG: hypothetical protein R3Y28_07590 [Candidatus Gastranaerophilales bacterium]
MKNKFLILTILALLGTSVLAEGEGVSQADAKSASYASITHRNDVCSRLLRHFISDTGFTSAINNACMDADDTIANFKKAVYPLSNNRYEGYREIYPQITSDFVVGYNNNLLNFIEGLVDDYCKYDSGNIMRKKPEVCSQEQIDAIFAE